MITRNKNAFTLVELSIAFILIAFAGLLCFNSFIKINPKVDKLRFKNANLSFKHAINNLITNSTYYNDEEGFADTSNVVFNDKVADSSLSYMGELKFRHLLLKELGATVTNQNLQCYMLSDSIKPVKSELCYKADNGIVWGIPNTDFKTTGVVSKTNMSGGTSKYVPVTIYFEIKDGMDEQYFYQNAIVLGVRLDGSIILINTVDCKDEKYKKYAQCDIEDTFASLKIKDKDNK